MRTSLAARDLIRTSPVLCTHDSHVQCYTRLGLTDLRLGYRFWFTDDGAYTTSGHDMTYQRNHRFGSTIKEEPISTQPEQPEGAP